MTETDLIEIGEGTDLAPYEPGLPFKDVVRGTVTRFLPGSLAVFAPIKLVQLLGAPDRAAFLLSDLALGLGLPLLGFGLGLELLRRWLYPDAEIDGRRSLIAGLATPIFLSVAYYFLPAISFPQMLLLTAVVGLLMAFATFFAWLSPTPKYQMGSEAEQLNNGSI